MKPSYTLIALMAVTGLYSSMALSKALTCLPPVNIQSMYEADKKQATIAWEAPANSATILYYKVANWQNQPMWQGTSPTQRAFQDQTLPGTNGTYTYYLSTECSTGASGSVEYNVVVTLKK